MSLDLSRQILKVDFESRETLLQFDGVTDLATQQRLETERKRYTLHDECSDHEERIVHQSTLPIDPISNSQDETTVLICCLEVGRHSPDPRPGKQPDIREWTIANSMSTMPTYPYSEAMILRC